MPDEDLRATLQRIEELVRTIAKVELGPVLERELADDKMKKLYALTGSLTAREATKRLKCSASTVAEAWQRSERLGLVVRDGKRYRKVL